MCNDITKIESKIATLTRSTKAKMTKYAMLSFRSEEDFKICNEAMGIKANDTAVTSFDGMLTVLIKTENLFPPGTLMVTANNGQRIFVRVMSGTEQPIE